MKCVLHNKQVGDSSVLFKSKRFCECCGKKIGTCSCSFIYVKEEDKK